MLGRDQLGAEKHKFQVVEIGVGQKMDLLFPFRRVRVLSRKRLVIAESVKDGSSPE
jgi:hypothetical protein